MKAEKTYNKEAITRLKIGDKVLSSSGKELLVSKIIKKENKIIVLFDDDMEVDFDPYFQVKIVSFIVKK
jgi:preprotein translocase subunit YajC